MSDLKDKVVEALQMLDPAAKIDVQGTGTVVATMVSGSFAGVDEAERQKRVWDSLQGTLTVAERLAVEFVFTVTPDEAKQAV